MAATVSLTTSTISAPRARELTDAYGAQLAGSVAVIHTRDAIDVRAADLQAKLVPLGVDDVSTEGRLVLSGSVEIDPGLRRGVRDLPTVATSAELDLGTLPALFDYTRARTRRHRPARGARRRAASPSSGVARALVMTSASTLAVDESILVAEELQLQDGTEIVIANHVRHLTILAQRITVGRDVTIVWDEVPPPVRGAQPPADDGASYDPRNETSASAFQSRDGGDGDPGRNGERGFEGDAAPTVEIWALEVDSLPELLLRGGTGGTGGRGGTGGTGGHGAKGLRSHANAFNCERGPGWGGDGGDGGDGGRGGTGGTGGTGGDIDLYLTDRSHEAVLAAGLTLDQVGGPGGDPGLGGIGGLFGMGGEAGDPAGLWCLAADERTGSLGTPGVPGAPGERGDEGERGRFTAIVVSPEEFRTKWTAPQVRTVTPTEAEVGETVTIEGANFTRDAIVRIAGATADSTRVADTILQAEVPAVAAGWVEVVVDVPGGESSNPGSLKVVPSLGTISPSPAAVGTTLTITGSGFGVGCRVLFRGFELDPDTVAQDGTSLTVTLPTPTGPFEDAGGTELISVRNSNGVATAPVELELRRVLSTGFDTARNGYSFVNGGLTGVADLGTFTETYGAVEVAAMFVFDALFAGAWFGFYLHFFNDLKPGYSSGFSTTAAKEYWEGNRDLFADHASLAEVERRMTVAQGHVLSQEILGQLLAQAAAGVGRSETSLQEVEAVMRAQLQVPDPEFRRRTAAIMQLVPAGVPVLTQGFITDLSSSHGLLPIRIEYPTAGDPWDARLVVYDNAPSTGLVGVESRLVFSDGGYDIEHLGADGRVLVGDDRDTAHGWIVTHVSLEDCLLDPVSMPVEFASVVSTVADVIVDGPPVPGGGARRAGAGAGAAGAPLHLLPLEGEVRLVVRAEQAGTYTLAVVSSALGRSLALVDVPIGPGGRDVIEISAGMSDVVVRSGDDEAKDVTVHYGVAGMQEVRALEITGVRIGRRRPVRLHAGAGLARFELEGGTGEPVAIRLRAAVRADVAERSFGDLSLGDAPVAFTVADWTELGPDSLQRQP